jgi:tripartite-type tricarboxylate transporter receptor subunit TctC
MTYVPFAGSGPAINALLGGHLTAVFADYPTVVEQLKTGTLRALATTSRTRAEALPDVPTITELGLKDYEDEIWYGLVAPAKTPQDLLSQLSGWAAAAINSPDMKPKLALQGLSPVGVCGSEFGALLRKRHEDYARVIRDSHIKAE